MSKFLLPLLLAVMTVATVHAKVCPDSGLEVPEGSTLMLSQTNPDEAWILRPDCALGIIPVIADPWYEDEEDMHTLLNCTLQDIAIVQSFPNVNRIDLTENPGLVSANFSSGTMMNHLVVGWSDVVSVDDFIFPPKAIEIDFDGNSLKGIPEGALSDTVEYLYMSENSLVSLETFSFPPSLKYLYLNDNVLESVAIDFPSGLLGLFMDGNPLSAFENITLPEALVNFSCAGCGIKSIRGVEFPFDLKTLNLEGNRILDFEIRESDINTFNNLDSLKGTLTQSACKDSSAVLTTVDDDFTVCVISDELFEQKYRSVGQPSVAPVNDNLDSSSNSTLIISLSVAGGIVLLVIVFAVYRMKSRKQQYQAQQKQLYATMESNNTIQMLGTNGSAYNSQEYLSNDVRNDESLIPFRIGQDEIALGRKIAKGGFGMVYMATFRGRDVAVKQLLPDKARDSKAIKSFMDEIRMCAQLDHPKVVQFVGIAWSNLLDIAVVTEFMSGGDLTTVLHTQERPDPRFWYGPCSVLKSKTLVALDIVEGLVYLHSFESPILHRDLKTRNVLLNDEGVAKLSDFGISRELSLDNTMTGEIGTVAWIAPEVLQGERYSEKADIYSFGVVLAELDTGRHPYENNIDVDEDTRAPSSHTNTRIAMLVSAGALQPSLSKSCPQEVKALAARCMSYSAEDRPSAVEIHYELCQIENHSSRRYVSELVGINQKHS